MASLLETSRVQRRDRRGRHDCGTDSKNAFRAMSRRFHLSVAIVLWVSGAVNSGPLFAGTAQAGAVVSSAPQSHIVRPQPQYTFGNQKFVYSVQWHFLTAGTSTVEIQHAGSGARVLATADSAGMPD